MKVAVSYPGCHRRGGVERVMLECVNYLADRGHEVHAIASEFDTQAMSPSVVRHVVPRRAPVPALRTPVFQRGMSQVLTGMEPAPDVRAGFGINTPPGGVVWMTSVHAAWIEVARATRPLSGRVRQRLNPFHAVALRLEERQLRSKDYAAVIALTDQVKTDMMRLYDVPADDITVIPNGYSETEFAIPTEARRTQMRQQLGYADHERVVVFVANELERKGFVPLLRAVAQIGDADVRVLAVGRLNPREAASAINRLGLSQRVQFTGPTSEVADFYAAADVFALPTKYEAWGLVVLEAMACGLPVLTSRLAGVSLTVQQGVNGALLNDPSDVEEITRSLRALLDGAHADRDSISASVAAYRWSALLPDYETVLAQHAR